MNIPVKPLAFVAAGVAGLVFSEFLMQTMYRFSFSVLGTIPYGEALMAALEAPQLIAIALMIALYACVAIPPVTLALLSVFAVLGGGIAFLVGLKQRQDAASSH